MSRQQLVETCSQTFLIFRFALPHRHHEQSHIAERLRLPLVTRLVLPDLLAPELGVALGSSCQTAAAFVAVPETAVHEDRPAFGQISDVWPTWKRFHARSIVHALVREELPHPELGLRVRLPDPLHPFGRFGGGRQSLSHRCPAVFIVGQRQESSGRALEWIPHLGNISGWKAGVIADDRGRG